MIYDWWCCCYCCCCFFYYSFFFIDGSNANSVCLLNVVWFYWIYFAVFMYVSVSIMLVSKSLIWFYFGICVRSIDCWFNLSLWERFCFRSKTFELVKTNKKKNHQNVVGPKCVIETKNALNLPNWDLIRIYGTCVALTHTCTMFTRLIRHFPPLLPWIINRNVNTDAILVRDVKFRFDNNDNDGKTKRMQTKQMNNVRNYCMGVGVDVLYVLYLCVMSKSYSNSSSIV